MKSEGSENSENSENSEDSEISDTTHSHKTISTMRHKTTQFGRLAMLYYPDRSYKSALRLFRREFNETKGMMEALREAGYKGNERVLTNKQIQIIEDFLGPMD